MERAGWSRPVINLLVNEMLQRTSCDYNSMPVNTDISYHVLQERNNFSWASISSASLPSSIARKSSHCCLLLPMSKTWNVWTGKYKIWQRNTPQDRPLEPNMGWKAPTYLGQELHGRTGSTPRNRYQLPYSLLQSS